MYKNKIKLSETDGSKYMYNIACGSSPYLYMFENKNVIYNLNYAYGKYIFRVKYAIPFYIKLETVLHTGFNLFSDVSMSGFEAKGILNIKRQPYTTKILHNACYII
jgi:hypothetical protein